MSDEEYQGEFSVYQFFPDEPGEIPDSNYERVKQFVGGDEAGKCAEFLCTNVAARMGLTRRVIITDGGDCINFEWKYGEGMTFPKPEDWTGIKNTL